ncbi:MAG: restriction endonuclease [Candidatus Electrothrix sp. EH2]|nr:restriction endonuclease [Candidatus Electrothrix sp. EH2]
METRSDRILAILRDGGGRMKVADVHIELIKQEHIDIKSIHPGIVSATVRQDNHTRRNAGRTVRFNIYADGSEERGIISLARENKTLKKQTGVLNDFEIPELIEEHNERVRSQLKEEIGKLTWQEFESNFLENVLEALGFTDITITERSHDGGKDAVCSYKRGLVQSQALVSAKHWKSQSVQLDEVQRMRGISSNADSAVIVTSAKFASGAIEEAKPSQNQRAVVLVDGDLLVETCLEHGIGVSERKLPALYTFRGFSFTEEEEDRNDNGA